MHTKKKKEKSRLMPFYFSLLLLKSHPIQEKCSYEKQYSTVLLGDVTAKDELHKKNEYKKRREMLKCRVTFLKAVHNITQIPLTHSHTHNILFNII